jgi:uncharacterized protein with GYD domain
LTSNSRFASITPSNRTWESKEDVMSLFLHQVAYSLEGWKALVANPQDRTEVIRPAIERLGGKIHNTWFAFGDYDVIAITEFPTNVDAAAIAIAFAAGGALRSVKTTPLLTTAEGIEALKKAAGSGYRAATASS